MRQSLSGAPFLIVGENIHATRVLRRAGRHVVETTEGSVSITFVGRGGEVLALPIHPDVASGRDFAAGRIKHVASAIQWGLGGPAREADIARAYIASMVAAQESAGADWLDLNTDEIAPESETRARAMAWLVHVVEGVATIPVAIDSSDTGVLATGIEASRRPVGLLLLNSASVERPEVLELAAGNGCAVVLAASGRSGMPKDARERVDNAITLVQLALARGLPAGNLYIDPLVLPVAVEPEGGLFVLEAAQQLRAEYGDAVHLTGGLSNVSFGLPERRLLNDIFIDLAAEAGIDGGIIDPVASDLRRVFAADRDGRPYQLAREVLLGRDPFGVGYVAAFRAGELATPRA